MLQFRYPSTVKPVRVALVEPVAYQGAVMVFPGFAGRIQGRDAFIAGFRDFCENAIVHQFVQWGHQIDVAGETVVVNFGYEMFYERSAERYHATGRDLWVFAKHGTGWLAVWRTMLDVNETAA